MSHNFYRWLIVLALLLPLVLVACGGEEEEPTATPEPVEEAAPTEEPMEEPTEEPMEEPTEEPMEEPTEEPMEEPTEEPMEEEAMGPDLSGVTISFWHVFRSGGQAEGMTELVAEFNDTNEWGLTVEDFAQGGQGDLQDAVNAAIASGDLPNVTLGFPNAMASWYSVGVIAPMNQFIEHPDYGLSQDEMDALYEATFSQGTLADGTQIGVPMHQSTQVLFYNDTWAQELGFDAPPANWAEFKEQVCAASEFNANDDDPDNDGTGGLVLFPSASNILPFLAASGGDFVNEARDAYTLNSPEMLETLLFLKDLSDSGCTLSTDSFPNPEFATRKALIVTSSTAGIPFQAAAFEEAANEDVWSLRAFPGQDGGAAVNSFGQLIGIVDTNEEQNLASWLFIKWLTSAETQAQWINWTGYFPSQSSTLPLLGDYGANNPLWNEGQELAPLGAVEPNLASYATVRGMIQDAGFAAMAAEDEAAVQAILDQLQADAEEAQAEFE